MNISFMLPGAGRAPVGGLKVVYEYANRLAASGHGVTLIHSFGLDREAAWREKLTPFWRYIKHGIRRDYGPAQWFLLHPDVNLLWARNLSHRCVPHGDVVIATAWKTAEWVAEYPASRGEKYYFLQHQEVWSGDESRVMETWKLPLKKLVISRWLQGIAADLGEKADYVPNGLDFQAFGMDVSPEQRDPMHVMMLHHPETWKGSADGLNALAIAREALPDLRVSLFGVSAPGDDLPDWVDYFQRPSAIRLRELYNEAAVFLAPSRAEGWGLPGSEAMMCGAAVVATDIGGHREFCIANATALMAPASDPEQLAQQVVRLCSDETLRTGLARAGNEYIRRFTWERAVRGFERAISTVRADNDTAVESTAVRGGCD